MGKKGTWEKGTSRNLESLAQYHEEWQEKTGGRRDRLKKFFNVEFKPLFTTHQSSPGPTPILEKLPPPPLHTFKLGPVNHLIEAIKQYYPEITGHLSDLHVVQESYHGSQYKGDSMWEVFNNKQL